MEPYEVLVNQPVVIDNVSLIIYLIGLTNLMDRPAMTHLITTVGQPPGR